MASAGGRPTDRTCHLGRSWPDQEPHVDDEAAQGYGCGAHDGCPRARDCDCGYDSGGRGSGFGDCARSDGGCDFDWRSASAGSSLFQLFAHSEENGRSKMRASKLT